MRKINIMIINGRKLNALWKKCSGSLEQRPRRWQEHTLYTRGGSVARLPRTFGSPSGERSGE